MRIKNPQIDQITAINNIVKHISKVRYAVQRITASLNQRALRHDDSKLSESELPGYVEADAIFEDIEYGSPEYYEAKNSVKEVIERHCAANRHHPEHFPNGVKDMNLVDIIEMLCDWAAAADDLEGSIDINQGRFDLSPQLAQILRNTVRDYQLDKVKYHENN